MLDKHITMTPSNVSLTGFASNVTGATWTLTTNNIPDGLAHQVSIRNDSITNHSGKTALLTGLNAEGLTITETVTLPNTSATVESSSYFKTLTSIVPSATIGADTMDIGWVDEFVSPLVPLDSKATNGVGFSVYVTGTINYTVECTNSDVQVSPDSLSIIYTNSDDTAVVSQTASKNSNFVEIPVGMRVKVNSYTDGATIALHVRHNG